MCPHKDNNFYNSVQLCKCSYIKSDNYFLPLEKLQAELVLKDILGLAIQPNSRPATMVQANKKIMFWGWLIQANIYAGYNDTGQ